MELPNELKADLHHTLLGPLDLGNHIFGALIPGCIFSCTLLLKGSWATALLSYPLLGYKTKLSCAVLASYVFGKAALSGVAMIEAVVNKAIVNRLAAANAEKPLPESSNAKAHPQSVVQTALNLLMHTFEKGSPELRSFVTGLLAGQLVFRKGGSFQFYAANMADAHFYASTGLLLLVAAFIPGSDHFRVVEGVIATLMIVRAISSVRDSTLLASAMLGSMVGDFLKGLTASQLSTGLRVIGALSQIPTPAVTTKVTPAASTLDESG